MTLQKLELVPKEIMVQFEGASSFVRPKVEYLGRYNTEMPVLARQDGFAQLYMDNTIPVYIGLKAGRKDGYSSLAKKQPLVQAKKVSKETMVDVLSRFGTEVLEDCGIYDGILSWQPEKQMVGYKLPNGMNAVMYRNWDLNGEEIDVSKAEVIPVNWMKTSGKASREMVEKLGIPKDTDVYSDREYAIKNYDGLNQLLLDFRFREWPGLDSDWEPRDWYSYGGSLLGSGLSADEMVKNFDPSKAMSEYQLEMQNLENDLAELKELKNASDEKIESMDQRIANLKIPLVLTSGLADTYLTS